MPDTAASVPQKSPLELVDQGRVWLLREYTITAEDGQAFSTHDSLMEGVRTAKSKMDEDMHPCTLRWESVDSVSNIYWNPLFERVDLRYDELSRCWTIVPAEGTCAIAAHDDWQTANERAKEIQYDYEFKRLRAYGQVGEEYEEREHRYLRHNLTDSGVRFDRSNVETHPAVQTADDTDDEADEADEIQTEQAATPSMLGVSIPDVTKVEFVDTDGVINRYATPWGDGTRANVVVLSRKYADNEDAKEAFETYRAPWKDAVDCRNVAPIYEQATDPTPWVAYRAGDLSLWDVGHDMSVAERLDVLEGVARALNAVSGPVCGIRPENIRLWTADGSWRVVVGNWGIDWAVPTAVEGLSHVTAFTAPEQIQGQITDRTSLYQLGAVAYWLLCESVPVDNDPDAIERGDVRPPDPISGVSPGVSSVLDRALAREADERYRSPEAFYRQLCDNL
jgi:hypothetical protein